MTTRNEEVPVLFPPAGDAALPLKDGSGWYVLDERGWKARLRPRQVVAGREYMLDHSKEKAARRAGSKSGGALFRGRAMKLYLAQLEEKQLEKFNARQDAAWHTKLFVLNGLKENYERAMTAVPVLDRKGRPTGEWQYEGGVANTALELMGKELGMFKDNNKGVIYNDNRQVNIGDIDSETRRLLSAVAKRLESGPGGNGGEVVTGTVETS